MEEITGKIAKLLETHYIQILAENPPNEYIVRDKKDKILAVKKELVTELTKTEKVIRAKYNFHDDHPISIVKMINAFRWGISDIEIAYKSEIYVKSHEEKIYKQCVSLLKYAILLDKFFVVFSHYSDIMKTFKKNAIDIEKVERSLLHEYIR